MSNNQQATYKLINENLKIYPILFFKYPKLLLSNMSQTINHSNNFPPLLLFYFLKKCSSFLKNFIYLFMAVLGPHGCVGFLYLQQVGAPLSLRCAGFASQWLLLLQSTGSRRADVSSRGSRAQALVSMWDLPRPGMEPLSPALAGGFLTAGPPGKSPSLLLTFPFTLSLHPSLAILSSVTVGQNESQRWLGFH